jgi:hypothetical protein
MGLALVSETENKQLRSFRRGRVSVRREVRKQTVLRNKLEKRIFGNLNREISRVINTRIFLYREFGLFEESHMALEMNESLQPIMYDHYRRIFKTVFESNEEVYESIKSLDLPVFGRNRDIETLILAYNQGRLLYLDGISAKMAKRVSNIITLGRREGWSLDDIAKNIRDEVLPIGRSRAALIARTETHNASSFAHHQYNDILRKDLGMQMKKIWSSTSDARTRSIHNEANGQIVDMDEKFMVGGAEMEHTGDPAGGARNNVNCRCVTIYADTRDVVIPNQSLVTVKN